MMSPLQRQRRPDALALCARPALSKLTNLFDPLSPPLWHPFAMILRDQTDRAMRALKPRAAAFGDQSILNVINGGIRHRHRTGDFQERRRLDHLHMAPKMPGVVAEVAKPPSAWPGLDLERQRFSVGHYAFGTQLIQHRLKDD